MSEEFYIICYSLLIGVLLMVLLTNLFFYIQVGKSYVRAYLYFLIAILIYLLLIYTNTFGLTEFDSKDVWHKILTDQLFVPLVYAFYANYINTYFKVIFEIPDLIKKVKLLSLFCALATIIPFLTLLLFSPKIALFVQFSIQLYLLFVGVKLLYSYKGLFYDNSNRYIRHLFMSVLAIFFYNISYYIYVFLFLNADFVFNPFHFISLAFFVEVFISSNANAEHYKQLSNAIEISQENRIQHLEKQKIEQYRIVQRKERELEKTIQAVLVNNSKLVDDAYKDKIASLKGKLIATTLDVEFVGACFDGVLELINHHQTEKALYYIDVFAVYLRALLNASIEEKILLSEEIELINRYLELDTISVIKKKEYVYSEKDIAHKTIKSLMLFKLLLSSETNDKKVFNDESNIILRFEFENSIEDDFDDFYTRLSIIKNLPSFENKPAELYIRFSN